MTPLAVAGLLVLTLLLVLALLLVGIHAPAEWSATTRCGTYAGRHAHQRLGEAPCPACRKAIAAYVRRWRQRSRCAGPSAGR